MIQLSIIIPAYNAAATIEACLESVRNQTISKSLYEIIVVDDASRDDTAELAESAGARVVRHPARAGAGAARNSGVQVARGDIICFTDADCEPIPAWIEAISAPLLADPEIAAAKGVYATRQSELVARFVQIEYEDRYDRLRPLPRIDFVDTHSAAFRREVLVANGGFDGKIHFAEDRELAYRLAARGYQMVFQPEAVVYHWHSPTLARYFRKKFFIGYWVMQTLRRFPERSVRDSHTPQVMKLQILLMAAFLASTAVALPGAAWVSRQVFWLPGLVLLAFLLTTIPFVAKAWPKDRQVALISPFLLAIRALALGLGYAFGVIKPLTGMAGAENTLGGMNYILKRLMDILAAGVGLALAAVLSPLLLPLIWFGCNRPFLNRLARVGQGGRPFCQHQLQVNHSRKLGRLLHRWRLDRLPALWHVLKGDMSLIGPKPDSEQDVLHYADWHRRRLSIKPGIINPIENAASDLDARVRQELNYIDAYSIWGDVKILVRTIQQFLRPGRS